MDSDHKPLERMFTTELNDISLGMQRMRLKLQRYDLIVTYRPGKEKLLADALSRAYLPNKEAVNSIELPETMSRLAISTERKTGFIKETNKDKLLQQLKRQTQENWPEKNKVKEELKEYYAIRHDITKIDELLYKDNRLIVPTSLRKEFMMLAHQSHGGICACLRRVRESIYWPRMTLEMRELIKTCETCKTYPEAKISKEPLMSHEIGTTPWTKLGIDIFYIEGRALLVISDYFTNYITVRRLREQSTREVIKELLATCSIHGIPEYIV